MNDPVSILEAAYQLSGDERSWLGRFVETAAPFLDEGRGVHAWTFDASRTGVVDIRNEVDAGVDERVLAALFRVEFSDPLRLQLHRMFQRGAACTLRGAAKRLKGQMPYFSGALDDLGLTDVRIVNAVDPTHLGCFLVAPSRKRSGFHGRESQTWRRIASHLATAFRVRRRLSEASRGPHVEQETTVDAVLRPSGEVELAEGPAQGADARMALSRAAIAMDRARGSLRRQDPDEAVATWQALVAGRWSLVDHFDADGRRFVLAHSNPAAVPDVRGLTLRERQVLAYAEVGHSNKLIAYELGLSPSTVAEHLSRARLKLALPSGTALHRRAQRG
jgi:DNA-binding CsgD family transcriptional regulator